MHGTNRSSSISVHFDVTPKQMEVHWSMNSSQFVFTKIQFYQTDAVEQKHWGYVLFVSNDKDNINLLSWREDQTHVVLSSSEIRWFKKIHHTQEAVSLHIGL